MRLQKKHTLLSILTVALVGITGSLVIPTVMHQRKVGASGTISVTHTASPSTVTVGSNTVITVAVNVPTSLKPVGALRTRVNFDSAYLQFVSYSTAGTAFDSCTYSNNAATTNLPNFVCPSTSGSLYTGQVATVTLKALQVGTTTVTGVGPPIADIVDWDSSNYTVNFSAATVTITGASTNNDLQGLTVSTGTLTPAFSPSTTSYTVNVPNTTSNITITATAPAGGSKSGDGAKTLAVGANTYTIVSTSESGATKNYTVVVNRAAPSASNNADLSALSVSGYSISPAFSAGNTSYTLNVPNAAGTVTINATAADAAATIAGTGSKVVSVGANSFVVEVTAGDGTKKSYTINVTRADAGPIVPDTGNSDSTLKSLSVSGYTLKPGFSPSTTSYSMSVAASIDALDVAAVPNDPNATVVISGNTGWKPGVNNITIKVTAEDGSQTIYTVAVTRASASGTLPKLSSDNTLSSLKDSTGLGLFPDFEPKKTTYDVTVPYEIEKLGLVAIANHPKAKVEITGDEELKVGMNNIEIKVTAEDGSVRYYMVNVTRSAASGELKELSVAGFTLNPAFDPLERHYKISVGHDVDCVDVTATPLNPDAKVTVTGNCDLQHGHNLIRVRVEYENGKYVYYYIEVDKAFPPTILGMAPWMFWTLLGAFLLLVGTIIFLLIRKRRKTKIVRVESDVDQPAPIVFRPEFNFGSKNNEGSQNDIITGDESNMTEEAPIDDRDNEGSLNDVVSGDDSNMSEEAIDDRDTSRMGPSSDLYADGRSVAAQEPQIRPVPKPRKRI